MSNSGLIAQCSSCKFWQRDEDSYSEAIDAKRCKYVAFAPDAQAWNDDYDNVLKPEFTDTKAFVSDASGYSASFYTKADFSCNQYKEKE